MTDTDPTTAPRPVLADHPGGIPVLSIAAAAALGGIFWFPVWFFSARLLRLWAPRGGVTWLSRRGVPEYTDEQYASAISWIAVVPIVARIALSFDWLTPFETLVNRRKDPAPASELVVVLDIVLGAAIALGLTGVLVTRGRPRLLALAGFVIVTGAALVIAFAPPYPISGFAVVPLAVFAWLVSQLAIFFHNAPQRRARRAAREAIRIEDERRIAEARKERGY